MLIFLAFLQAAALAPPPAAADPAAAAPVAATPVDNIPEPYLPLPGRAFVPDSPAKTEAAAGSTATPEDIAADSARDLKDNRYYNKPGASRADYDADWQDCRLIARGSITPGGRTTVIVYNPAVISPAAATGGGVIGALIASAIEDGQLRRANRRSCLLFRGWRLVEVESDESARLAALPESERGAAMNRLLGDPAPKGRRIIRWTNQFAAPVLAGAAK